MVYFFFLFQDVEPVKCTINITESKVSSQYLYVKWSSPGIACNFSLICSSRNFWQTTCDPTQTYNDTYECTQTGLEAGTVYDITIEARKDGEATNLTLQTGMIDMCIAQLFFAGFITCTAFCVGLGVHADSNMRFSYIGF